jgi:hypothetical protein
MCCGELCTKQEWEEHICEAELRLRSQLRAPFGPQAGDIFTHEQDPEKMGSTALFRILFWPRLGPSGWIFFGITARRRREKSTATSSPL